MPDDLKHLDVYILCTFMEQERHSKPDSYVDTSIFSSSSSLHLAFRSSIVIFQWHHLKMFVSYKSWCLRRVCTHWRGSFPFFPWTCCWFGLSTAAGNRQENPLKMYFLNFNLSVNSRVSVSYLCFSLWVDSSDVLSHHESGVELFQELGSLRWCAQQCPC